MLFFVWLFLYTFKKSMCGQVLGGIIPLSKDPYVFGWREAIRTSLPHIKEEGRSKWRKIALSKTQWVELPVTTRWLKKWAISTWIQNQ